MGILDGQAVSAAVTNPAFLDATADDTGTGIYTWANSNVISGATISNGQREWNAHASFVGMSINQVYNYLPTWTNTNVGLSTDTIKARAEALTLKFVTTIPGAGVVVDNAVARFDGTTGNLIQQSGIIISDTDDVTNVVTQTFVGGTAFIGNGVTHAAIGSTTFDYSVNPAFLSPTTPTFYGSRDSLSLAAGTRTNDVYMATGNLTGAASTGNSGSAYLSTGTISTGSGDTGTISISSGLASSGYSGNISIVTGDISTTISGSLTFNTGASQTSGTSGPMIFSTGLSYYGNTGTLNFSSGNAQDGSNTGTGNSGELNNMSGDADTGNTGTVTARSGDVYVDGNAGAVRMIGGTVNAGNGNGGSIVLSAGGGSGTGVNGLVTLTASADRSRLANQPTGAIPLAIATTKYVDDSVITSSAGIESYRLNNLALSCSVAANALTVALKGQNGSNPSGANKVDIGFRNSTASSGTFTIVQATTAISVVVSSGSTLGQASAIDYYINVYALNASGTIELSISTSLFDEGSLVSTTAEGGAGAADSNAVMYSTTARTNVPFRLIGRLKVNEATAGSWASAPTEVSLIPFINSTVTARAYINGGVSLATSGVDTLIPQIDNVDFDTVNGFDTTTRLYTVAIDGKYHVNYGMWYANNGTGRRSVSIAVNAAITSQGGQLNGQSGFETGVNGSDILNLLVGDTVGLYYRQDSGGALNTAGGAGSNFICITKI